MFLEMGSWDWTGSVTLLGSKWKGQPLSLGMNSSCNGKPAFWYILRKEGLIYNISGPTWFTQWGKQPTFECNFGADASEWIPAANPVFLARLGLKGSYYLKRTALGASMDKYQHIIKYHQISSNIIKYQWYQWLMGIGGHCMSLPLFSTSCRLRMRPYPPWKPYHATNASGTCQRVSSYVGSVQTRRALWEVYSTSYIIYIVLYIYETMYMIDCPIAIIYIYFFTSV